MKVIKEHIKSGNFKQFYLLYGSEGYLKNLYRGKLITAILGDDSAMNFTEFVGKNIDLKEFNGVAQTLPFFSNQRLILVENSGLFKNQSDMVDLMKEIPDSTLVIFVEDEVDKRSRLYKFMKENGTISEMNGLDDKNLKLFVASLLEQDRKRISESTVGYFLEKCGTDMMSIRNEIDKLISYTMDRDIITVEDIDAVVTVQISGKIFQMIDALGSKQQNKALAMYYDLLSLREKPMSILFLITRHFNILLQVKDLSGKGVGSQEIAEKVGIPPFSVSKYLGQARNFTLERLIKALEFGTDVEEQVKTGRMIEKIGVELLIITLSSKN